MHLTQISERLYVGSGYQLVRRKTPEYAILMWTLLDEYGVVLDVDQFRLDIASQYNFELGTEYWKAKGYVR